MFEEKELVERNCFMIRETEELWMELSVLTLRKEGRKEGKERK